MAGRKESSDLFQLIKSMSPEEKSYYIKFAKRYSEESSSTLKLFEAINKQKDYNEVELKKNFKNYAVLKNYVLNTIIESMMISNKNISPKIAGLKSLIEIEILKKFNLNKRALDVVKKNKEDFSNKGLFFLEEQYARLEHRFMLEKLDGWGRIQQQEKFDEILSKLKQRESNYDYFVSTNNKLFGIDVLIAENQSNIPKAEKYIDLAFHENSNNALTTEADNARIVNLSLYYSITQDKEKYYQLIKSEYLKIKNNLSTETDIVKLRSLIYSCIETYRFKEVEKYMIIHERIKDLPHLIANTHPLVVNMMWQYLYWDSGKHDECITFINSIEKKIDYKNISHSSYIFSKQHMVMKALTYYSLGNNVEMNLAIQDLLKICRKEEYLEVYKNTEILKIFALIKMKNYNIAAASINNLLRSKSSNKILNIELRMLKELQKLKSGKLDSVFQKIIDIQSKSGETLFLMGYLNLNDIICAHNNNLPLAQVLKERQVD